jgi:hypothetical protein
LSSVSRHVLLTAAVAAQEKRKRPRPFGFHLQYPFGGTTSADLDSASPQRGSASPGRATYLVPAIPGRPFLGADPVFAPSPCRPRASLSARQGTAPPDGLGPVIRVGRDIRGIGLSPKPWAHAARAHIVEYNHIHCYCGIGRHTPASVCFGGANRWRRWA